MNEFPHEKKKILAKQISNLRKKEDMVKVLEIIYSDNKNITENQNGLFMMFNELNDSTYYKIESFLKTLKTGIKKKTEDKKSESKLSEDKSKFVTFAKNEFSDTLFASDNLDKPVDKPLITQSDSKIKYSNREKNIIKRQRYSEQINSENNTDSNVEYSKFDLSDTNDTTPPSPVLDTLNKTVPNAKKTAPKKSVKSVKSVKTNTNSNKPVSKQS